MGKEDTQNMLTAKDMVERYQLELCGDRIRCRILYAARPEKKARVVAEITARKQELVEYLRAKADETRKAEAEAAEERKRKLDAIPGLREIQDAKNDLDAWWREFNRSFEGDCGGLGVRPKPKADVADIKAMLRQYPAAAAYLRAEEEARKSNYELAAIGERAVEKILSDPNRYAEVMAEMDKELEAFSQKHAWD